MKKSMFAYTKEILERVSFDPELFRKELQKAVAILLPYEVEQLSDWVRTFVASRPDLQSISLKMEFLS